MHFIVEAFKRSLIHHGVKFTCKFYRSGKNNTYMNDTYEIIMYDLPPAVDVALAKSYFQIQDGFEIIKDRNGKVTKSPKMKSVNCCWPIMIEAGKRAIMLDLTKEDHAYKVNAVNKVFNNYYFNRHDEFIH